jgi:hypothetical protein
MRIACESVADNELCSFNALASALTAGRRMTSHMDMLRRSNNTHTAPEYGILALWAANRCEHPEHAGRSVDFDASPNYDRPSVEIVTQLSKQEFRSVLEVKYS